MLEVGRVCMKLAGRDSGLKCAVVDVVDKNFVLIDGQTRRKRCNILHLEPMNQLLNIKKNASHEEIKKAFKEFGIEIIDKKSKPRMERQKASIKEKKVKEEKSKKKTKK